jgi:hypothetical protein
MCHSVCVFASICVLCLPHVASSHTRTRTRTRTHAHAQACQAALALDPAFEEAARQLVRALLAASRFEEAVTRARELLQANQRDAALHQVGGALRVCVCWGVGAVGPDAWGAWCGVVHGAVPVSV